MTQFQYQYCIKSDDSCWTCKIYISCLIIFILYLYCWLMKLAPICLDYWSWCCFKLTSYLESIFHLVNFIEIKLNAHSVHVLLVNFSIPSVTKEYSTLISFFRMGIRHWTPEELFQKLVTLYLIVSFEYNPFSPKGLAWSTSMKSPQKANCLFK